jgi:CheY-like chemotaxis protein
VTGEARENAPDPLLGTVLSDRYRVERVIGVGGVGAVYRATQIGLDRRVAVKVLKPELTDSRNAMERFAREARTAAGLQHPNIVTVHDFGRTPDGRAYLVMEFLEGLNLAQWIRAASPPDVGQAVGFLVPVCDAIGALHDSGIIHRDIKPSNIMIVDRPGGARVKVVDFGLVRPNISDDTTDLTGGLVLGTPEFMAPELFTGQKPDERSDVYALGVTAFEAIAGVLPFGTGSFREMFHRHTNLIPPRPSALRGDLPEAADEVLFRALAKAPSRRYTFATDLAAALESAFAGVAIAPPRARPAAPRMPAPTTTFEERVTRLGSILLVDDDAVVRGAVAEALDARGFDVTTAADGIDAFLLLGSSRFDVIVSDVEMPNLDGITLLRLAAQKGIRTPVVFLAGTIGEHDRRVCADLGAAAIFDKPIEVDALAREIHRLLNAAPA